MIWSCWNDHTKLGSASSCETGAALLDAALLRAAGLLRFAGRWLPVGGSFKSEASMDLLMMLLLSLIHI